MHIAAAEWILRLPEGRGRELLDAGCKAVLLVLWNHARWKDERDATCEECYPSAPTIADQTGSSLKATRKRLARLVSARWVLHEKRANREWGWALAWRRPFPLQGDAPGVLAGPLQVPQAAPPVATDSPHRGTKPSTNEPIEPSHEHTRASQPAVPTDSPSALEPPPPRPRPRERKPRPPRPAVPKPGQTGLDLPDTPPTDPLEVAMVEILADQERLRAQAYAAAGLRPPKFPGPITVAGKAIRVSLRQALRIHGPEVCRRVLAFRGAEWAADPAKAIRYSTDLVWSTNSLAVSIPRSAGGGQARASPRSNGRSWIGEIEWSERGDET